MSDVEDHLLPPIDLPIDFGIIPPAPEGFRSGFVGIVGRPNVGKSTLMNQLVGQKIAITSPVAQTTRNRLRGILTTPTAQIIFVDTPGIHKPHHSLGEVLVKNAQIAIRSVDVLLFVVDGSTEAGGGDRYIADLLKEAEVPVILGINKADQQEAGGRSQESEVRGQKSGARRNICGLSPASELKISSHPLDQTYRTLAEEHHWSVTKFSALTGEGVESLLQLLIQHLEPGPYYYPPDLVTDQPERFIMGELIREQILLHTREEVPHSVAVTIDRVEEEPTITRILATIYVERNSQKGIVIGKKGSMLKEIGTAARQQIQKLVMGNVYLELFVKVQPKWRQSRTQLAELGYRVEE
ncbi:GTPase Era [Leptothermofonsia sp. ETS-13]|uniref:GTPase Era n=1 Tax=Leptothermofonsia sp. ETS-13 TaxID=3035696 RepID=UPI003BA0D344